MNTQESESNNLTLNIWLCILVWLTCLLVIVDMITRNQEMDWEYYEDSYYETWECNVSWIVVRGYIDTYSKSAHSENDEDSVTITSADSILDILEDAKYDDEIEAVIIEIDSYGGSPVAAEEIAHALQNIEKPTYAHIRWVAASGGYWIATSANTIYASKNSSIWSIGATMSYLDQSKYNEKEGYSYNQISSWKFKDSGSSDKQLSEEEKALFQRDVNIIAKNFIDVVSLNRNIPIDTVQNIADGSTVLWQQALDLWLIDKIWVMNEVYDDIENDLAKDISICWN